MYTVSNLSLIVSMAQTENNDIWLTWWQKFWYKIAILDLPSERKTEVAEKMVDYSFADALYWFQFVLSSVIATLWLLINSSPVVIWAMLISPILQPIQSFAFAVNSWHKQMYIRSLNNLFFSVVVGIAVALLITLLVPFSSLTAQIISRTTPTFVDLFIALAGGTIAMLALWYNRLSDTLAGVAMAASLLPPLCVVWIWLAFVRRDISQWSMMLFLANLIALVLVGLLIFYLFGFFPTDNKSKHLSFSRFFMIIATVVLIAFPLWTSMQAIALDYRTTQTIQEVSQDYLYTVHPQIKVLQVAYVDSPDVSRITLSLQSPEWVTLTSDDTSILTKYLFVSLQKSVELDVQISYVASVYKKNIEKPISDKEIAVKNHFWVLFSGSRIDNLLVDEKSDGVYIQLSFLTALSPDKVRDYLAIWKKTLQKYRDTQVVFDVEVSYIDRMSF